LPKGFVLKIEYYRGDYSQYRTSIYLYPIGEELSTAELNGYKVIICESFNDEETIRITRNDDSVWVDGTIVLNKKTKNVDEILK
jgi:hypothetical protein